MKLLHRAHNNKHSLLVGLIVLLALLFSAVSHSHDFPGGDTHIEQLDCKLCHCKAEPKISHIKPVSVNVGVFKAILVAEHLLQPKYSYQALPGQRAPPTI